MSPGKLLTDMSEEHFTDQLYLQMMREMLTGLREVNASLHGLQETNMDIVQRLSKIEARPIEDLTKTMAAMDARLKLMEDRHLKEDGARSFVAWLKDYTPWLAAIGIAIFAYLEKKAAP